MKLNFKKLFPDMKKGIERFPITIMLGILFFILAVIHEEVGQVSTLKTEIMEWIILIFIGIFLSAALEVTREKYYYNKDRKLTEALHLGGMLIFLLLCKRFYLNGSSGDQYRNLELTGIFAISYLIFLLVPIIEKSKDREKYFQSVVINTGVTVIFSMVLFLGVTAIIGAVDMLLFNVNNNLYFYTFIFSASVFGVTFFLSRLKGIDENMESYDISRIGKVLLSYIVIPLIIGYTVILYIYAGKILVLMNLPKGIVSHLVLWYMTFTLFIIVMVTPLVKENRLIEKFKRWFPIFSIPLIILALVAIFERIFQYGVTENRYIIVMVIIWLMFNMAFYIFRTDVRIVIVSLITVVFISLFTPLNMTRISERSQNRRLEKLLVNNGFIKNGNLVKNEGAAAKGKKDIIETVDYFYYSYSVIGKNSKTIKINGKEYKDKKSFVKEIGGNESWYGWNSIEINKDMYVEFIQSRGDLNQEIIETGGYNYYFHGEKISENEVISSEKFEIRLLSQDEIVFVDKNTKEEIWKISLKEEAKKVYGKVREEVKKSKENRVVLPTEKMSITRENGKIKYKIFFKWVNLGKNEEIEEYRYDIYFSI